MASPIESPTWERKVLCGCKGCAVARKPLQEAIERVRELHKPNDYNECAHCLAMTEEGGHDNLCLPTVAYPCPTIKALDGE